MSVTQYIALKPCTLAGQQLKKDDLVPDGLLTEREAATVISYKLIAPVAGIGAGTALEFTPSDVVVPIIAEDGKGDPATFKPEAICDVFAVLQHTEEQATGMIQFFGDVDMLQLLAKVEHRPDVHAAVEARIQELTAPQPEEQLAKATEPTPEDTPSHADGEHKDSGKKSAKGK